MDPWFGEKLCIFLQMDLSFPESCVLFRNTSVSPRNIWAVCAQLRSEVTPHFLSRFISRPPYPPREFSCALSSVEPFSEEPRLHRLTSLSLRLDSQMFLHSEFRLGGGDLHPCFLTSSPYHSPCLKGGKLQEKTCCTCQNTGLPLMDMHETHYSKTMSAVH